MQQQVRIFLYCYVECLTTPNLRKKGQETRVNHLKKGEFEKV